jgi:hypothetical protein
LYRRVDRPNRSQLDVALEFVRYLYCSAEDLLAELIALETIGDSETFALRTAQHSAIVHVVGFRDSRRESLEGDVNGVDL